MILSEVIVGGIFEFLTKSMSESLHAAAGVSLNPSGSITPASEYNRSHAGSLYASEDESGAGHHNGSRVDVEHVEVYRHTVNFQGVALAAVYTTFYAVEMLIVAYECYY